MAPTATATEEQVEKATPESTAPETAKPVLINIEGDPSPEIENLLATAVETNLFAALHHLSPGGFTILVGDQGDISFTRR